MSSVQSSQHVQSGLDSIVVVPRGVLGCQEGFGFCSVEVVQSVEQGMPDVPGDLSADHFPRVALVPVEMPRA